ncbi:MAG: zf-HC2 domain-containing protein [Phycisphaerales bacterium]|nr:zf-HC2 domain-containing protein [Phycisphaerales bacterium]
MNQPSPNPAESTPPYLTCREVLDFLMGFLDGELTEPQREAFARHLAVCPSCVNYVAGYRTTVRATKAATLPPGVSGSDPAAGVVPEGLIRAIREARRAS